MNKPDSALDKATLILKHLRGELSSEETEQLSAWLNESQANRVFFTNLLSEHALDDFELFTKELNNEAALKKIKGGLKKQSSIHSLQRWKAAAAILLLAVAGALSLRQIEWQNREPSIKVKETAEIIPGGNKATLTLGNGVVVPLDGMPSQGPRESGGARILEKEGAVIYQALKGKKAPEQIVAWNTMRTPAGGQYRLVLPDGSRVWLNAESELHFPSVFSKDIRAVRLNGEAYFEIEPGRPFLVNVSGVEVEVLGTHFNVKAYKDEGTVETTLAEGRVKVSGKAGAEYLLPGKQAKVNKSTGRIAVQTVDPEVIIAWTRGLFRFHKEPIEEVMKKVARWYGVEVAYVGERPRTTFTGVIVRDASIYKVLDLLEMTGGVQFQVEGREIRVSR